MLVKRKKAPEPKEPDRWLTVKEVSRLTGLSKSFIYGRLGLAIELTPIKLSKGAIRFSEKEVLEWMARHYERARQRHHLLNHPTQPQMSRDEANRIVSMYQMKKG